MINRFRFLIGRDILKRSSCLKLSLRKIAWTAFSKRIYFNVITLYNSTNDTVDIVMQIRGEKARKL